MSSVSMPGGDKGAIPVLAPGCDTAADKADGQSRSEEANLPSPHSVGGRGKVKCIHQS